MSKNIQGARDGEDIQAKIESAAINDIITI